MIAPRFHSRISMRCVIAVALTVGCGSSTFVDCPSFDRESCLDTEACRYRLYGDGSGECRNVCDGLLKEDPCPDGFSCTYVTYYDPELDDQVPGPLTDLCVDD